MTAQLSFHDVIAFSQWQHSFHFMLSKFLANDSTAFISCCQSFWPMTAQLSFHIVKAFNQWQHSFHLMLKAFWPNDSTAQLSFDDITSILAKVTTTFIFDSNSFQPMAVQLSFDEIPSFLVNGSMACDSVTSCKQDSAQHVIPIPFPVKLTSIPHLYTEDNVQLIVGIHRIFSSKTWIKMDKSYVTNFNFRLTTKIQCFKFYKVLHIIHSILIFNNCF